MHEFCSRCRRLLELSAFTGNRANKDGRQRYCRDCQRAYVREHYAANTEYYLTKAKRSNHKRRNLVRAVLLELKSVPCMDCGGSYPPWVMEFDHVRGVKLFNISESRSRGPKGILGEAAKCEIVCANCHRERTQRRLMRP